MKLFPLAVLVFAAASCVPEQRSGQRSSLENNSNINGPKKSDKTESQAPRFPHPHSFFQDGITTYTNLFTVHKGMDRTFSLRGQSIHDYIEIQNRRNENLCLVQRFETNPGTYELLILAASAETFNDTATNTREFYFLIHPHREPFNQRLCQSSTMIDALSNTYPQDTIVYSFFSLCQNCSKTEITSSFSAMFHPGGGTDIDALAIDHIVTKINDTPNFQESLQRCDDGSDCKALGYDCCLEGQCIRDKTIKSGADRNSPEFLQSQREITFNPSAISDYPDLYNICPISDTVEILSSSSREESTIDNLTNKRELYKCLNPHEGEMSLCTITYKNREDSEREEYGGIFKSGADDLNFTDTYTGTHTIARHGIHKISYGGTILFEDQQFLKEHIFIQGIGYPSSGLHIQSNNDLLQPTTITISEDFVLGTNSPDREVKITYKTNGSCVRINKDIAKCKKIYIQGQNLGKVTDHYPSSQNFLLPFYADLSKPVKVAVEGNLMAQGKYWSFSEQRSSEISFTEESFPVYDTQEVELTFFVNLRLYDILQRLESSRDEVRAICECEGEGCNLKPVKDTTNRHIVDYGCVYPKTQTIEPPMQEIIQISSKTVPLRYFDRQGAPHTEIDIDTTAQEGTVFEYIDGDPKQPNNVEQYIGFNEIYGTINAKSLTGPHPAKEVPVIKGKFYDIFVGKGQAIFSSCLSCGNDYWSDLLSIFPRNFTGIDGGGYVPNYFETNPKESDTYRKDDLLFGRACFLPVTMIPWTHKPHSDRQAQRLDRYNAQHFLFANGYQRDWYGFDYGSLIGSWDGLVWFSIGNERRVRAKSNHLFLAVNAYWGDLTDENIFTITILESTPSISGSGSSIANDFDSDGAECQKYHVCDTDRDCISRLGWDYACESIADLKTLWPKTDSFGMELPDSGGDNPVLLRTLFNQFKGPSKRCVYRGRGSPCSYHYQSINTDNAFNSSNQYRHHVCSTNNHCHPFMGTEENREFNTKIARFGQSPKHRNGDISIDEDLIDTFGLHTQIIGRPMEWNGRDAIPNQAKQNTSYNKLMAVCIPGRSPDTTLASMNISKPQEQNYKGDRALGIGMSRHEDMASNDYLASCPVLDNEDNLIHFSQYRGYEHTDPLSSLSPNTFGSMSFWELSSMQNTSTSALNFIMEAIDNNIIDYENNIYKKFDDEHIAKPTLEPNSCLRMPGAACFSDYDCAPSKLINNITQFMEPDDNPINDYELNFWKEPLVCSQKMPTWKQDYNLKENRCCRELGKQLTVGTWKDNSEFDRTIPGIDIPFDSDRRYTLYGTVRDLVETIEQEAGIPEKIPLLGAAADSCTTTCLTKNEMSRQYEIFPKIPERVCCNGDWVREFHEDNGGGHHWRNDKFQTDIEIENFKCYNWIDIDDQAEIFGDPGQKNDTFTCRDSEQPFDLDCGIRSVPIGQAHKILDWVGTLELTGIPQVTMPNPWNPLGANTSFDDLLCEVDPTNQQTPPARPQRTIPGLFKNPTDTAEISDGDYQYYSLDDMDNFNADQVKQIFSEDKVVCCIPAGEKVPLKQNQGSPTEEDQKRCCTGYISPQTGRCALRDYTDLSVYFNRFVSSGAKELDANKFDENGFIKSSNLVEFLACQKQVCDSGTLARGIAWSNTKVPGHTSEDSSYFVRQFLDNPTDADEDDFNGLVSLFEAGLKWNTHVYCVPEEIDTSAPELVTVQCTE